MKVSIANDLSNEYNAGDNLKLNLEIVNVYSDEQESFDSINLLEDGKIKMNEGKYPILEEYLKK